MWGSNDSWAAGQDHGKDENVADWQRYKEKNGHGVLAPRSKMPNNAKAGYSGATESSGALSSLGASAKAATVVTLKPKAPPGDVMPMKPPPGSAGSRQDAPMGARPTPKTLLRPREVAQGGPKSSSQDWHDKSGGQSSEWSSEWSAEDLAADVSGRGKVSSSSATWDSWDNDSGSTAPLKGVTSKGGGGPPPPPPKKGATSKASAPPAEAGTEELKEEQNRLKEEQDRLTTQNAITQKALQEMKKRAERSEALCKELETNKTQLQSQRDAADERSKQLQSSLNEANNKAEKAVAFNQNASQHQQQMEQTVAKERLRAQTAEQRVAQLESIVQSNLSGNQQLHERISREASQVKSLQDTVLALTRDKETLAQKVLQADKRVQEAQQNLQQKLAEANSTIDQLQRACTESGVRINQEKVRADSAETARRHAESERQQSKAALAKEEKKVKDLRDDLDKLKYQVDRASRDKKDLSADVDKFKRQADEAKQQAEQAAKSWDNAQKDGDRQRADIKDLKGKNEDLSDKLRRANKKLEDAETKVKNSEKELEKQLKQNEQDLAKEREKSEHVKAELQTLQKEAGSSKSEQELQAKLDEAENRIAELQDLKGEADMQDLSLRKVEVQRELAEIKETAALQKVAIHEEHQQRVASSLENGFEAFQQYKRSAEEYLAAMFEAMQAPVQIVRQWPSSSASVATTDPYTAASEHRSPVFAKGGAGRRPLPGPIASGSIGAKQEVPQRGSSSSAKEEPRESPPRAVPPPLAQRPVWKPSSFPATTEHRPLPATAATAAKGGTPAGAPGRNRAKAPPPKNSGALPSRPDDKSPSSAPSPQGQVQGRPPSLWDERGGLPREDRSSDRQRKKRKTAEA